MFYTRQFPRKVTVYRMGLAVCVCALYTPVPPSSFSTTPRPVTKCETLSAYCQDCLQLPQINQIKSNQIEARLEMLAICLMSCCHRWATGRQAGSQSQAGPSRRGANHLKSLDSMKCNHPTQLSRHNCSIDNSSSSLSRSGSLHPPPIGWLNRHIYMYILHRYVC